MKITIQEWLKNNDRVLLLTLIILHLIPIWYFKFIPTTDGLSHLYNAHMLGEYFRGNPSVELFYMPINGGGTNWLGHIVLAGLMSVFPALIAEKIFLSAYVILFPLSIRYALSSLQKDTSFLSFLAFPLIFNSLFYFGFYYFSFSITCFFFLVGYWVKNNQTPNLKNIIILTLLSLVSFLTHPMSIFMFFLLIACYLSGTLFEQIAETTKSKEEKYNFCKSFLLNNLIFSSALLPAFFFITYFIFFSTAVNLKYYDIYSNPAYTYKYLYPWLLGGIAFYATNYNLLLIFISIFFILLISLLIYRVSFLLKKKLTQWDFLPLLISFIMILPAFSSNYTELDDKENNYLFLLERCLLYTLFISIFWIGTIDLNKSLGKYVKYISSFISIVFLALQVSIYPTLNSVLNEVALCSSYIKEGKIIYTINAGLENISTSGTHFNPPPLITHAEDYLSIEKNLISLNNYQGKGKHFPLSYRPSLNPYVDEKLKQKRFSPFFKPLEYEKQTGQRVDYLLFIVPSHVKARTEIVNIFEKIRQDYEVIYTSPTGLVSLFVKKNK